MKIKITQALSKSLRAVARDRHLLLCHVISSSRTSGRWQDGFARFTQTRYSSEPRDVANTFMHLTNVVRTLL
jgi:hypothetical protein